MPLESSQVAESAAWLRLAFTPGLTNAQRLQALRRYGGPQEVLQAAREDPALAQTPQGEALRSAPDLARVDDTLRWLQEEDRHLIVLGDPRYPASWLQIADPPLLLFARGDPRYLNVPSIAMVGSRNASMQGTINAEAMARTLSEAGLCVVSGLALGIDAAAHRGGLAGRGSTVAVMGTGPDLLYPASNKALGLEIAAAGCIVTEFALGTHGKKRNFPRRNRLISGLCLGVVVVEAARKSGSLGTAQCALMQNREVMAVPGSIHDTLSKGCHQLIREGASLVESAHEVMDIVRWPHERPLAPPDDPAGIDAAAPDPVLNAVGYAPTSIDRLAQATGLPFPALAARLTRLEIAGRIAALAGGRFARLGKAPPKRVIE